MIAIRNYTKDDLEYIQNNYKYKTVKEIANDLNKSENSIYNAIRKLGLIKQIHNEWTSNEIEFLKSHYIDMTSDELSKYINHSVDAINTMRDRLKLVRNREWSHEDINYLKDNFNSMLFCDLSNILGRTEGAIRGKCFELGLSKTSPWSDDEVDFIRKNYMEMPTSDIAAILCRTTSAIQLHARRLGLKKYPYTCNYHYFDVIDTAAKAYWLGFLSADGWINMNNKSNAGVTGIELQYRDIEHLKKFNKSISGNYKITDRWRECKISTKDTYKKHHMCVIRIFSLTMYNALKEIGFSNNKSYDFCVPKLKEDLIRHYMRGYFDGDGCLCYTNQSFSVTFNTASKKFFDDLIDIINQQNIKVNTRSYINSFGTTMYRGSIDRNQDKVGFLDWIYSDCSVYLDRKYKKYLKIKNNKDLHGLAV